VVGCGFHIANLHGREGILGVIGYAKDTFRALSLLFADGGYAGDKLDV
jgi:hypothetical protein